MKPFRTLIVAAVLVLMAFATIAVVFDRGEEHRNTDTGPVVDVVDALISLRADYFEPMEAAVVQAGSGCRDAPSTSNPPSCKTIVDEATRLDPRVLEVISTLEAFEQQLPSTADEDLIQGLQRNLALARHAHEFNVLLSEAWSQSDQGKWDAAWAAWDRFNTELGAR